MWLFWTAQKFKRTFDEKADDDGDEDVDSESEDEDNAEDDADNDAESEDADKTSLSIKLSSFLCWNWNSSIRIRNEVFKNKNHNKLNWY